MAITNTHKASAEQKKLKDKGVARPAGSENPDEGQFTNGEFNVIATKHGWTMGSYQNEDGTTGFIMTNGQSMFHFDVNGNIVMATGAHAVHFVVIHSVGRYRCPGCGSR